MTGAHSETVGVHYKLIAYVCGAACVKPSPFEGWVTFTQIMRSRPSQCRYAVAQMVPVFEADPRGPFVAWDLYDEALVGGMRTDPDGWIDAPPPLWHGETEDGLVMKVMALYEKP